MGKPNNLAAAALFGLISGCGGNTSPVDETNTPPNTDTLVPFAPSFWTAADYRMQKDVTFVLPGNMEEVLNRVETSGLEGAGATLIESETYDEQNRFQLTEIAAVAPGTDANLPENRATALLIEHTYKPGSDVLEQAHMLLWDNWYIGASGQLQQEITWTDLAFEHDIPIESLQMTTDYVYDGTSSPQELAESSHSTLVYNAQHLLIERNFDLDDNLGNGYETYETWERDDNGLLQAVTSREGVVSATYEWDERGRLAQVTVPHSDGTLSRNDYYYQIVEGVQAIVIESVYNPGGDGERYETKVMLMDDKPCHSTTINRLRFSRPENANCFDANHW